MTLIEASLPVEWHELQVKVEQIYKECGFETEIDKNVSLARGSVDVDVYAEDRSNDPVATYICECKLWNNSRIPRSVVHSFRTVISDSGANFGIIISAEGFQSGAIEAAGNSNVLLFTFSQFQNQYIERWWEYYAFPIIHEAVGPLIEYTEPVNSRVSKAFKELNDRRKKRFLELRELYELSSLFITAFSMSPPGNPFLSSDTIYPTLPIVENLRNNTDKLFAKLPNEIVETETLREFVVVLLDYIRKGIDLFDDVFGKRI